MGWKVCIRASSVLLLRSRTPKDSKSFLLACVAIRPPVSSHCPFSEHVQPCVHVSPSDWSRWGSRYVTVAALGLQGPSDLASSASQGDCTQLRSSLWIRTTSRSTLSLASHTYVQPRPCLGLEARASHLSLGGARSTSSRGQGCSRSQGQSGFL